MAERGFPTTWRDPDYLAAIAGTVSTTGLFYYSAVVSSAPSSETIGFVLLWVFGPAIAVYWIAQRAL
jgi:hypothetical protein